MSDEAKSSVPGAGQVSEEVSEKVGISVPAAGKRIGLSRNAAYEAARAGLIPTVRFGRRIVVPVAAFERMLDQAGAQSLSRSDGASQDERR